MEHSFNVQFAQKYGIEEAIIVHNFYFWLRKNIANEKHLHNGRYWTYNSNNAFTQLFPYINKTKIFRVLKHLEECDIILKDNFNTSVWDKTLWYSFSDHGLCELYAFGYDVTDFGKMNHRDNQSETTIPYNKHTDNNKEKEIDKSISKKDELFEQCWKEYKRKGSKAKAKIQWNKLSQEEKDKVITHIKAYVQSRELQYQKDFERYLKDKIFDTLVIANNNIIYDPTMFNANEYRPTLTSQLFFQNELRTYIYIGFWDGFISDGYNDNNRPNGASIMLNNGRGTIIWNKNSKQWILTK